MTTQEINRQFHEALGKCWHTTVVNLDGTNTCSCGYGPEEFWNVMGHCRVTNPDYCADPQLVLKGMMEREDWQQFVRHNADKVQNYWVKLDLIMDTTGRLANLVIEWLKEDT